MSIVALERPLPPVLPAVRARANGRRLGDRRREPRGPQRTFVVDQGCDVRIGHLRLEPETVLALLDWLPITHADLAPLETQEELDPLGALGLVLRPPTIWAAAEALALHHGRPDAGRVTPRHIGRLRLAAGRVAAQLPLAGLPRASDAVAVGCATVAADDAACVAVAGRQLVRYATCRLIGRL